METAPTCGTERLILRSLKFEDVADIQALAGDADVASTTESIPHPYEDGDAAAWIKACAEGFEKGTSVDFAVTCRADGSFIGAIGLVFRSVSQRAELGYWIGKPYWNRGYCTEAARRVVAFAFEECGVESVYAYYFQRNPASGRVLEKIGMRHAEYIPKDPKRYFFEDMIRKSLLKGEFISANVRG